MPPRGAPRTDARLQRDAAIITAPACNVAPNDAVAALHRIAENVGSFSVDLFDITAGFMAGDNRQGVAVTQRSMPAVYVRAAKSRGCDLNQQRSGFKIRNGYSLNRQRLIMGGDNGSA